VLDKVKEAVLWPAYLIYEGLLMIEVGKRPLPDHLAVILDGNRRYAQRMGFENHFAGHEIGAEKVKEFLEWCLELGLNMVTLYAFSTENFQRKQEEVDHLMSLFQDKLYELASDEIIHENHVRVQVIGNRDMLPEGVKEATRILEEATETYDKHFLYIALAYGGRSELVDAARKIVGKISTGQLKVEDITESVLDENLYIPNMKPVDFVIRTSGERRISNFLLWQSQSSWLSFLDVTWPDIRKIDFLRALRVYQKRKIAEASNEASGSSWQRCSVMSSLERARSQMIQLALILILLLFVIIWHLYSRFAIIAAKVTKRVRMAFRKGRDIARCVSGSAQ